MSAIDLLKRPLTSLLLAATLSLPVVGSGCVADVGDDVEAEAIDDTGAEVDETSMKEDARVRPAGRFQVPEFEIYGGESDVGIGYTYGLEIYDNGWGTRDYGVRGPIEGALVGRREVSVKFTRSGTKRYIRLTESTTSENPTTVRYEYKMSRGNLRLRAENSTGWITLKPAEMADADLIDEVKTYYNEDQETAEEASEFEGELPLNVELNVDQINHVWGDDYPAIVRQVYFENANGEERGFLMVCEDNDGGGTRDFYTKEGTLIARGSYSESTEFTFYR